MQWLILALAVELLVWACFTVGIMGAVAGGGAKGLDPMLANQNTFHV
jgi:hypothetical protein